jgi:hypothetical protein
MAPVGAKADMGALQMREASFNDFGNEKEK